MKTISKIFTFFSLKNKSLGISLTASKNTFGSPGGSVLEGAYFVWQK